MTRRLGRTSTNDAAVRRGRETTGASAGACSWTFGSGTATCLAGVSKFAGAGSLLDGRPPWRAPLSHAVEAEHQLGDAGRLGFSFNLDRRLEQPLDAIGDLGHVAQLDVEPVPLSLLEGRREPDLVEPVVDHHGEALDLYEVEEDPGDQRHGEVPVRDGLPERRLARDPLAVHVDPLLIPGRVGDLADR